MKIFDVLFILYFLYQFVAVIYFTIFLRKKYKVIRTNIKRRIKKRKQDIVNAVSAED